MTQFAYLTERCVGALLFDEIEEYHQATAEFTSHVAENPDAGIGFHNRARAYWEIGETDKALCDFRKAIGLLPHDHAPAKLNGMLLSQLGRLDDAIASLDIAVSISPNEPTVRRTRADLLVKAGRLREALIDFDHAIEFEPTFENTRIERHNAALRLEEERRRDPPRW